MNHWARTTAVAAAVTWVTGRVLRRSAPVIEGWTRSNYRDRSVSLLGGASVAAGTLAGAIVAGDRRAVGLAAVAAVAGGYDDLVAPRRERRGDKGWRGHVTALRHGRLSGGTVKVVLIGGAAVLAGRSEAGNWRGALPRAALTAGTANLVNLFDLRPGRAGKVAVATALVGLHGPSAPIAGAVLGPAAAALPDDLGERTMLGDLGANTLGVLLGYRLARSRARWPALAVVLGLTAASEKISFTELIERTAVLRRLDEWGRAGD